MNHTVNTDRLTVNTSSLSDDDRETSATRKDTRKMDSCTEISDCDKYSTVENDPEDNNGRSADGFITVQPHAAQGFRIVTPLSAL
jgi:hypothetical protein